MMAVDDLFQNIAGIIFLGTPHRGVEISRTVSLIVSSISRIGLGSKSPMLKQLKPNSDVLQNLSMQFRRVLHQSPIGICSAFETHRTRFIGIVSYLIIFCSWKYLLTHTRSLARLRPPLGWQEKYFFPLSQTMRTFRNFLAVKTSTTFAYPV